MNKPLDPQQENKSTPPQGQAESANWVMVFSVLTGQGAEESKKIFKLHKRRIVIGSALSSDVRVQQNSVSNVHAVVELDDKNVAHIYDMASETGVFVNGQKVVTHVLKAGDELKIGFAHLAFSLQPLKESAASLPTHSNLKSGTRKLFRDEKEDFSPLILEDERNVIEIFDYPQSGQLALQVTQYWDHVIMDVRHYAEQQTLQIGEARDADFLVPGFATPFPFIQFENGECVLSFTEDMEGIVRTKQGLITLKDIKAERRNGGAFRISLKTTDFVKLQVKGLTFFISFTPEPPTLRRQRLFERDPLFMRFWMSSLALSVAFIFTAISMELPKPLEVAELPPRVATIIFKPTVPVVKVVQTETPPEKAVEPVKKLPDTVKRPPKKTEVAKVGPKAQTKGEQKNTVAPKKTENKVAGGDAGQGARAAGNEGKKGRPNAKPAEVAQEKSRGNPNAATAAKSQGQGKGVVESLASDLSGAISKSLSAGGKGADAAAGRLRGYGGFTTEGNGGLGNLGKGSGGGGESLDVAGLGTKGLGEGSVGNGLGAIGQGGNILGSGRGRPSIEIGGAQETIVLGGLDRDLIDQIIKKHSNQLRYCWEKEANAGNPGLRGRILTRFVISASGRVSKSGVENSTMNNANVENCVAGVLARIIFPEPLGGGIVEVSYPFAFSPALKN